MERWIRTLQRSVTDPDELAQLFGVDAAPLARVADVYPMRITPHYLSLVQRAGDPLWRQCVPDPAELVDDQRPDPLDEEGLSPVPGLIHRYPDRVVWLVSAECPMYCRFCMRKRNFAGCCRTLAPASPAEVYAYIAEHAEIRDVILSGGDPLLLADETLDAILTALRRIPHVEIVRIGTRVPVTLPERVTRRLAAMLKKHQPLYVNTHFNHPDEIVAASAAACARLADAGIPLGNQTVLLRGTNDSPHVMKRLMQRLLAIRVRPYYIHQMDLVRGTGHFRTPVANAMAVIEALRGHTSGLAVPHVVIDSPGGKGKVPVLPQYAEERGGEWLLRTYRGEMVAYPEVRAPRE